MPRRATPRPTAPAPSTPIIPTPRWHWRCRFDLSGATRPALSFQHQYALEAGYDFGYVEVSTNGGSAWLAPALAAYTGNPGAMSREQLDLSAYAGVTALRLRFRIVTDSSVVMDGWYVDDVRVAEAPAPVTLWVDADESQLGGAGVGAIRFAGFRLVSALSVAEPGRGLAHSPAGRGDHQQLHHECHRHRRQPQEPLLLPPRRS